MGQSDDGKELFKRDSSNIRKTGKTPQRYAKRILREGAFWQIRGDLEMRHEHDTPRIASFISGGTMTRASCDFLKAILSPRPKSFTAHYLSCPAYSQTVW